MEKKVNLPASLPFSFNYIHQSSKGTKYYIYIPDDVPDCYIIRREDGKYIQTTYLFDGTIIFVDDSNCTVILNSE